MPFDTHRGKRVKIGEQEPYIARLSLMNHTKIFLLSLPHLAGQHSLDLAYLQRLAQVPHLTFPHLTALLIPEKKKKKKKEKRTKKKLFIL